MALKTSVKPIARRIAAVVEKYSGSHGLAPSDYILVGTYDDQTERISLVFGTGRDIDEREWYAGLLNAILGAFPNDPMLTYHLGLVIQRLQNLEEIYAYHVVHDDELDLTDFLDRS